MTIEEIKAAVDAGLPVRWVHEGYHVTRCRLGQYYIVFKPNQNSVGLTNRAGTRLNGRAEDFFISKISL